jgi:hypothetical protein
LRGRPAFGLHVQRKPDAAHALGHRQRELRPVAAVDPDDVGPEIAEHLSDVLGAGAVGHRAFAVERHRGGDRELRRTLPRGLDRDAQLIEVSERLEHEQVGAALRERPRLLDERRARQRQLVGAVWPRDVARRPDRAPHIRLVADDLARDLRARDVEAAHLADEPVTLEPRGVGAEGVRLDDLGAGLEVVGVDLLDHVGPRDVELLEVLSDEDPALVEQRPHRAVRDEQSFLDGFEER